VEDLSEASGIGGGVSCTRKVEWTRCTMEKPVVRAGKSAKASWSEAQALDLINSIGKGKTHFPSRRGGVSNWLI